MYNALTLLSAVKPVNPQDDWSLVFATVVTGMVVVFFILLLLIGFIMLMGKVFYRGEKKIKSESENKTAESIITHSTPERTKNTYNNGINGEIVAAITAAVAAIGEDEGKTYAIKNISKRKNAPRSDRTSGWGAAGISESMRPFVK